MACFNVGIDNKASGPLSEHVKVSSSLSPTSRCRPSGLDITEAVGVSSLRGSSPSERREGVKGESVAQNV